MGPYNLACFSLEPDPQAFLYLFPLDPALSLNQRPGNTNAPDELSRRTIDSTALSWEDVRGD